MCSKQTEDTSFIIINYISYFHFRGQNLPYTVKVSQIRNFFVYLSLKHQNQTCNIYHHQSKRRSECANSVISNRDTACMSHMSTVDSHSDKRLKSHDTTNSRNLTNISFFEMEKITFFILEV